MVQVIFSHHPCQIGLIHFQLLQAKKTSSLIDFGCENRHQFYCQYKSWSAFIIYHRQVPVFVCESIFSLTFEINKVTKKFFRLHFCDCMYVVADVCVSVPVKQRSNELKVNLVWSELELVFYSLVWQWSYIDQYNENKQLLLLCISV